MDKVICINTVDIIDDCDGSYYYSLVYIYVGNILYAKELDIDGRIFYGIFNVLKDVLVAFISYKEYKQLFISLAEYREDRLKEVLNG